MIDLGQHAEFIASAYLCSALVIAGMIAVRLWAARAVRRRLDALEAELGRTR